MHFRLEELGWRAFQDLCGVLLREALGQTFVVFADSNDGGKDGAFSGHWTSPLDTIDEELDEFARTDAVTVAQCKFSSDPSHTLTPSALKDEVDKMRRLVERGECDAYLVLTNLRVTGRTDSWLATQARSVGVMHTRILSGEWICAQIERNAHLRRYVPRVYGLGDLGRILDERKIEQASALLSGLRSELATFVPTAAYRRASDALELHNFVVLLGEPAVGKSTIAAMLSLVALDIGGYRVKRVDGPDELLAAWDPHDPKQFFWIDDAFGPIRHEPTLTDEWTRRMDQIMAAVDGGARVLMTSRDYIYREARPRLKDYAYPRLREQQVVIEVSALSESEKRQILYNHLKAGDQPRAVIEDWRPVLSDIAASDRFAPELARRLSRKAFAKGLKGKDLATFFDRPNEFLSDILGQLDRPQFAALACVYASGRLLPAPPDLSGPLGQIVTRLGAQLSDVYAAFWPINGTFLSYEEYGLDGGVPGWRFKHPTIREGFARMIASDPNTLDVYLTGLDDSRLLGEIDCGSGSTTGGQLVDVPPNLYTRIIPRVVIPKASRNTWREPIGVFLRYRCSDDFLVAWAEYHATELDHLNHFGMFVEAFWQPYVLARLHELGALPEPVRTRAVARLSEYAVDFDPGWLDRRLVGLFTSDEYDTTLRSVERHVLSDLYAVIDASADGYESGTSGEERFSDASSAISAYMKAFADRPEILDQLSRAADYVRTQISSFDADEGGSDPRETDSIWNVSMEPWNAAAASRDDFDDVAEGRP